MKMFKVNIKRRNWGKTITNESIVPVFLTA